MFFKKNEIDKSKKDFTIEYYPESKRYYALYKGHYLKRNFHTGIYELREEMTYANDFMSEDSARKAIQIFKEQQFKENIKVIEVE